METATVITGEANIRAFQMLAIRRCLMLEIKTGMKHSRNAAVIGAQTLLTQAGKKAPRTKKSLLAAFEAHMKEIGVEFSA